MPSIIGGAVALILGLIGIIAWWFEFGMLMRGLVPSLLIIVGLVAIASGYSLFAEKDTGGGEK